MSMWWDDDAGRYRTSLPYKVFYVWLWPLERMVMYHCLKPAQAHWFGVHIVLPWVYRIDRAWEIGKTALIVPLIVGVWLLTFLPWFTCDAPDEEQAP